MLKKILTYIGYALLLGIAVVYFIFSSKLSAREGAKLVCNKIVITISDSAINRFLVENDVKEIVKEIGIEEKKSKVQTIDLNKIEEHLCNNTVIKECEANLNIAGTVNISITQRRPILRVETNAGGFYIDDTGYIFPLMKAFSSYVPILSGNIDVSNRDKILQFVELGKYIQLHKFWDNLIEQIEVDDKGLLRIISRVGNQEIIFGLPDNIGFKFEKLFAFYKFVIPVEGWEKYRSVDLRYDDQIVCKKKRTQENREELENINKNN